MDLPLKRWGLPQRGNDDLRPWGITRNRGATTTVTCKWEGVCERVRYNQERICEASPERVSWLEHQRMRNEQGGSVERASRLEYWGVLEQQSYDPHLFSSMIIGSLNLLPYTRCKYLQTYTKLPFGSDKSQKLQPVFQAACSGLPRNVINICLIIWTGIAFLYCIKSCQHLLTAGTVLPVLAHWWQQGDTEVWGVQCLCPPGHTAGWLHTAHAQCHQPQGERWAGCLRLYCWSLIAFCVCSNSVECVLFLNVQQYTYFPINSCLTKIFTSEIVH